MRVFFIGMFIIALLAGLAATQLSRVSSDQRTLVGHVINKVGLTDQENLRVKEKIDDLKQKSSDLAQQSHEHMRDQEQLLKDRMQDQLDRIRDQRNK